ncbi:Integrin beta-5 [Thelohanellus kitauei]|uniref:Integrin beta-5 n=1 Tax=Thelohanellus kitauei TaxID=669202 RepID=A0A0C2J525_THEKT|nr:Integrin beta-5 [Thelohanellus kitauei]
MLQEKNRGVILPSLIENLSPKWKNIDKPASPRSELYLFNQVAQEELLLLTVMAITKYSQIQRRLLFDPPEDDFYVFENVKSITLDTKSIKEIFPWYDDFILDQAEPVLDAMAQASECNSIGWDDGEDVMRLMIVITSSYSKRAGHGDMMGLFKPNDGKCKMGSSKILKTLDSDYIHPHILGESLSKNNIRVLFLTLNQTQNHYTVLSESFSHQIVGIKVVSNQNAHKFTDIIVEAVKQAQQVRPIKFNIDFLKTTYKVKHTITCPSTNMEDNDSLECSNVGWNQVAKLSLKMNLSASSYPHRNIQSYVKVNGFSQIFFQIYYLLICFCNHVTKPGELCNDIGYKVCGKCHCDLDLSNFSKRKIKMRIYDEDVECKNNQECGDYGKCVCGKCQCIHSPENFYGKGCKCSDLTCPYTLNGMCNGKGKCKCGICYCEEGYTGDDCSELVRFVPEEVSVSAECVNASPILSELIANMCEYNLIFNLVPTIRCSDIEKCMENVFSSKTHLGCNISVTVVEKFDEPLFFLRPICQTIHQNCMREYMLHINEQGSKIDLISLKKLNPLKDCVKGYNFKKTIFLSVGITSAVTLVFMVIMNSSYYFYKKWQEQQRIEKKKWSRWARVLNFFMQNMLDRSDESSQISN